MRKPGQIIFVMAAMEVRKKHFIQIFFNYRPDIFWSIKQENSESINGMILKKRIKDRSSDYGSESTIKKNISNYLKIL